MKKTKKELKGHFSLQETDVFGKYETDQAL